MIDRLRKIEILVRVADAGSFSRAAQAMLLSPSAVSHAISQLERELGARLFYRTTRQLRLTAEGDEVVSRGRDVLERMSELGSAVRKGKERIAGELRIGLPSGVACHVVMPRIASFLQRYPDLRLRVMSSGSVRDMHVSGADVNIRIGEVADSSLVQRPLATFRFGVYGSDSYLHTHGIPGHPQELLQHRCLIHKSPRSATLAPWNQWDYVRGKERGTVTVPDVFVTDDREALLVAAQGGAGLFRIGMFSPRLLAAGGLVPVMPDWQWPGGPKLSILYRKQSPQPRRIAVFIEFMMATVASFDPLEATLVHR